MSILEFDLDSQSPENKLNSQKYYFQWLKSNTITDAAQITGQMITDHLWKKHDDGVCDCLKSEFDQTFSYTPQTNG